MRPRALDLFCGAGGVSMGLHRAGFDVTGVDIRPQPRHPVGRFIRADALDCGLDLAEFDLIWASPPCQAHSKTRAIHGYEYPDLIPQTRDMLAASGAPYVIENVVGAPLRSPITLCGTMFGLKVIRHRLFETSFPILAPICGRHGPTNSHRGYSTGAEFVTVAGNNYRRVEGAVAMGIDWPMTRPEMSQAIPPAYAEFIGRAAIQHIGRNGMTKSPAATAEARGALVTAREHHLATMRSPDPLIGNAFEAGWHAAYRFHVARTGQEAPDAAAE